jgi:hypothetical protein
VHWLYDALLTDIVAPITAEVCHTLGSGLQQHKLAVCELRGRPGTLDDYAPLRFIDRGSHASPRCQGSLLRTVAQPHFPFALTVLRSSGGARVPPCCPLSRAFAVFVTPGAHGAVYESARKSDGLRVAIKQIPLSASTALRSDEAEVRRGCASHFYASCVRPVHACACVCAPNSPHAACVKRPGKSLPFC